MNWKAIINWLMSAIGAFGMGFFATPIFVDGMTVKMQLATGFSAGIAAMISHIRNNPFKLE